MGDGLSELMQIDGFAEELSLVPKQDREDATQTAWIAWHIADPSDKNRAAIQALNTFAKAEKRHRRRERATEINDDDSTSAGIEKRISQRFAAPRQSIPSTHNNNAA